MSTVTRRSFVAAFLIAVFALLASGSSGVASRSLKAAATAPTGLAVLELNPLAALGTPGRLRSVKVADASRIASVPAELMVYRVVAPTVSLASVEAEAKRFGVQGRARRDKALTMVRSAVGDVVVDNITGSVNWITPAYEAASTPMRSRLSDEEYAARAQAFMEERGLWESDYFLVGVGQYTVEDEPVMVEVSFGRRLNGRPWQGVGPKKTVAFGGDGEIVGFFSVWREVKPLTRYPLVRPIDAIAQVEAGDALVSSDELDVDAIVEQVELVYLNDGAGVQMQYVAPYYRFSGKTVTGRPFTAVTRAIPLEYVNERAGTSPGSGGTSPSVGRTE